MHGNILTAGYVSVKGESGAGSRVGVLAGLGRFKGRGGRKATARAGRAVAGNLDLETDPSVVLREQLNNL